MKVTLRDGLLVLVIVAMALSWWVDRQKMKEARWATETILLELIVRTERERDRARAQRDELRAGPTGAAVTSPLSRTPPDR